MTFSNKGRLRNIIVQLVELDLDQVEYIQYQIEPVKDKMNSYFSRVNQLYFEPPVKDIGDDERQLKIKLKFSVCVYNSVGKAFRFNKKHSQEN